MKIAVVEKITSFSFRGKILTQYTEKGLISAAEFAKIKQAHDDHQQTMACVLDWLNTKNIIFERFSLGLKLDLEKFDCVVTVGGDGTLLAVSHQIKNSVILLGVRSSGTSVGFLCCCDQDSFPETFQKYLDKTLNIVAVTRVSAKITHANDQTQIQSCPALNDILYTNENPAGTTRYRINLNNNIENHHSSGVWISTSAGSSAGIMAAGGEQMELSDQRIQYCVREPYAFQKKKLNLCQGFVDLSPENLTSSQPIFSIENRCDRAVIALDGQEEILYMEWGDKVEFLRDDPLLLALA